MTKNKQVGIYVRLSKEDSRSGESVSIENQKLMLTKHVSDMGWELREIYQDDGFSGTNQNRPAFKRMIDDVKAAFINTVLIKDLSRLGRNYLEVGNLAEVFLPQHGCELISLNEKLDEMMVFRNWFNEQHSKTTSAKVRMGKRVSAQNGKFVGAYAPYGYVKDPANCHKLIVDQNTAPIVRRIFELRGMGTGCRAIAAALNRDMIMPPRDYYYQRQNRKNPSNVRGLWNENTIRDMLKNEAYIGNTISGKTGSVSYKNQRQVRKDKNDWIRADATHEPLIDPQLWEKVQALTQNKYRPARMSKDNLFAGLLYCPDCGFKLRGQTERRQNGSQYVSYMCSTYARNGKAACTIHGVSEKALTILVADRIRAYIGAIEYDRKRIAEAIFAKQKQGSYRTSCQNELTANEKHLDKLDMLIENLYTDKVAGLVPDSFFKRQIKKYEKERAELEQAIAVMRKRTDKTKPAPLQIKYPETIDAETLRLLVDKITVGEGAYVDGQKLCNIKVVYRFEKFSRLSHDNRLNFI